MSGLTKIVRGGFPSGLSVEMRDKSQGAAHWYRSFLDSVVIPHGSTFGYLIELVDYARRSNARTRTSAHGAQTGRSVDRALLANARSSTQPTPPFARACVTKWFVSETSVASPA